MSSKFHLSVSAMNGPNFKKIFSRKVLLKSRSSIHFRTRVNFFFTETSVNKFFPFYVVNVNVNSGIN